MESNTTAREQSHQTIGVIRRLATIFDSDRYVSGRHYGDGGYCLVGAINASTAWTVPGVRRQVMRELAADLPAPLRAMSAVAGARAALAFYNDVAGRRRGVRRLVKTTLARLDPGWPYDVRAVSAAPQTAEPRSWTAKRSKSPFSG